MHGVASLLNARMVLTIGPRTSATHTSAGSLPTPGATLLADPISAVRRAISTCIPMNKAPPDPSRHEFRSNHAFYITGRLFETVDSHGWAQAIEPQNVPRGSLGELIGQVEIRPHDAMIRRDGGHKLGL